MPSHTPTPDLNTTFGARVAAARKQRGLTQEALAERVDTGPQTIRRLERGQTTASLDRVADIARALGVSPASLLDDTPMQEPDWDVDSLRVVELWRRTPSDRRALLLDVLAAFARTG